MALRLSARVLPPSPEPLSPLRAATLRAPPRRRLLLRRSSKNDEASFTDRILDYIEGGPKLRKWYGAPDLLPKDGGLEAEEDGFTEAGEVRDAVFVTNGESELGQMVILSLILKQVRIKAFVKDKRTAIDSFGTYVEPINGDKNDKTFLRKALRSVRAIICPSDDGFFSDISEWKGVQHIVLLSQLAVYSSSSGLQALMNSKARTLAERDEKIVIASGVPYTIIKTGLLQNNPGGKQGFCFEEGAAKRGRLSKEDAALISVEALDAVPKKGVVFEVANGEEKVSNWKEWFASLIKNFEELQ